MMCLYFAKKCTKAGNVALIYRFNSKVFNHPKITVVSLQSAVWFI